MALTLDKAKAKELRDESSKNGKDKSKSLINANGQDGLGKFEDYLPTESESDALKEKYKSFLK